MSEKNYKQLQEFYRAQLLEDCIPFWLNSECLDYEYGGYITSITKEGKRYDTDKAVWFQGRGLWTFSMLCNKYGENKQWIDAAKLGKVFLESKCVDKDGRLFFRVTQDGKPLRKRRYPYSEIFYISGMAEYGLAAKDENALQQAEKCFDFTMGIYKDPNNDPYKIPPKEYQTTRFSKGVALPMALVGVAQTLWRCQRNKKDKYEKVIKELAYDITETFCKPDEGYMLEVVGKNDEKINTANGRTINPGHTMECGWFIMNAGHIIKDKELINRGIKMLEWGLEKGWDNQYGGFYYFVDCDNMPCEPLEWDMKLWWVHNESLIALLFAYELTKDEKYWNWFLKVHDYCEKHFHDKEHGEWYGYLHKDGTVSHTQKGTQWKGPYHLPRALMLCESILLNLAENKETTTLL